MLGGGEMSLFFELVFWKNLFLEKLVYWFEVMWIKMDSLDI